jgi:hypothetical protein
MPSFLELLLEGIIFGHKQAPKPLVMYNKVTGSTWQRSSVKPRYKKILNKEKLPMVAGRALIDQTRRTRIVWDPKGYANKRYYDNMYKSYG